MDRRKFMKGMIAVGGLLVLGRRTASGESGVSGDNGPSIGEEELLGIRPPQLYGDNYRLRKEASEAFLHMRRDAERDKIRIYCLRLAYSYRSFYDQREIWNRKFKERNKKLAPKKAIERITKYSAIPGTSRHHWGTDVDVIAESRPLPKDEDPLQAKYFEIGGPFEDLARWLKENAGKYGFLEVYTNDSRRTGTNYEPWHMSFKDLSIPFLKQYMEIPIESIKRHLEDEGVEGSQFFSEDSLLTYENDYVLGINPKLIPPDIMPNP